MPVQQALHTNVIALMEQKAKNVCAFHDAEKQMIEFGELLRRSNLRSVDRRTMADSINHIATGLVSSDERNAKAYLVALAEEIGGPPPAKEYHPRTRGTVVA